jgi:Mg-chelatase subunit ChlD
VSEPAADLPADLAALAARLRAHPDVLSGPSVRALLAAADVHAALGALAAPGGPDTPASDTPGPDTPGPDTPGPTSLLPAYVERLLRAALVTLPHRLRVRPGADAEQIVRDAVLALAAPDGAAPPAPPDAPPPQPGPGALARPVFSLAEGGDGEAPRPGQAEAEAAGDVDLLLGFLLRPAARGPLADGRAPTVRALPPGGERSSPAPLRPGDRARDLSVRATLRAALRAGVPLSAAPAPAGLPPAVLRARPPRPDVALDVVLALDVSASMEGSRVAPVARALASALLRAGHRVGVLVFSAGATQLCGLTRDPGELLGAAVTYRPENPTNLEVAIWAGTDLLARAGSRARAGALLLVTDADPTICGTPVRAARGHGAGVARVAALAAAADAAASRVPVSVLCPPPGTVARVDLDFAARLAAAGGGAAACYPA